MKKTLIAGLATIIIAGSALIATGMYAASASSSGTSVQGMFRSHMRQGNPEDIITTLSWQVSTESLTALQTLISKHKTEIDAARSNTGTTLNKTAMNSQRQTFKTQMDALLNQYPELKVAMPTRSQDGKMGHKNREIETIMATLPPTVKTEIDAIHDSYDAKEETLRTEKKAKIDAILTQYPEIKAKLDAIETNRPQGKKKWGHKWMNNNQQRMNNGTNSNQ